MFSWILAHLSLHVIIALSFAAPTSVLSAPTSTSIHSESFESIRPVPFPTVLPSPPSLTYARDQNETQTTLPALSTVLPSISSTISSQPEFLPGPSPPDQNRGLSSFRRHRNHYQTPIVVFFEVLSSIAGFALVFNILRCYGSYVRTPPHDRVSDVVARHRLQLEMQDIQRRSLGTHFVFPEPLAPPPYLPRPPSYEESSPSPVPSSSLPESPADIALRHGGPSS